MTLKPWAQPKLEINGLVLYLLSLSKKKTLLAVKKRNLPVTSSLWSHRKKGLSKKIETSEREQFFGPPSVAVSTGFPENPEFDFNQPAPVLSDSIRFDLQRGTSKKLSFSFSVCLFPRLVLLIHLPKFQFPFCFSLVIELERGSNFWGFKLFRVSYFARAWVRKVSLSLLSA